MALVQELKETDSPKRVEFCRFMQQKITAKRRFLATVMLFSDEARFSNNGSVNRHNCHYYAQENPPWIRETQNVDLDTRRHLWFQQDGAPPHFHRIVWHTLYKRSLKCNNLLQKIVAMPSRKTVLALLQNVPFHIGINEHLFKHMLDNLPQEEDIMCVLLFDEMDISQNLQYDAASDRILGFEELVAGDVSENYANRALVFMCHGLVRQWKQPVAYYFSNNVCSSIEITRCLHEVLVAAKHS
jgi:hypothetical protein